MTMNNSFTERDFSLILTLLVLLMNETSDEILIMALLYILT